ncbi:hypothetical protein ZYGR_0H03710 [Zygosaccharomyces rouxii]|uniref:ZYRO0B12518p n=2 Tax=Zygosaccharomyces rouxii TaxID=4956 RepID=C5DRZ3_ZYGRC|nr:uncharacterized protein ZYRO0B12518g [Zygosaccharomyces rouxii]KAH9199915.1 hypothetical protein LQ764DRAFT_227425 [Zygosaccharomyces rouxii]GAV47526.1 hypothetical protein ZYGR_0H03710 [Zygosaccharomyces rouxii]CAR26554.1 ZYRO0B12518p [Zygosaccharomyces rouxii]
MPPSLFDQQFVHCGVCHRQSSQEDPLYLTSCAHTVCSQHMNVKICPICHISDILVIKLAESKQLPDEIKMLFQPIPSLLENLHNVSQFQITGMINQCHYYQDLCEKLKEKCARQRQLLFQAKQELDSVAHLKSRIAELESQLQLQSTPSTSAVFSGLRPNHRAPDTVDLTLEDNKEESFIRKLKTTNSLRNKRHTVEVPNSNDSSNSSISNIMAESTQVDKLTDPSEITSKKSSDLSQFSNNLPHALNKLRIVKRNHTLNNNSNATTSRGHQGLVTHMRSSSSSNSGMRAQTQTNLLMRRNTTSRAPIGNSQGTNNNKFRRVR